MLAYFTSLREAANSAAAGSLPGSLPGVASTVIKPQVRLTGFLAGIHKNPSQFFEFVIEYLLLLLAYSSLFAVEEDFAIKHFREHNSNKHTQAHGSKRKRTNRRTGILQPSIATPIVMHWTDK